MVENFEGNRQVQREVCVHAGRGVYINSHSLFFHLDAMRDRGILSPPAIGSVHELRCPRGCLYTAANCIENKSSLMRSTNPLRTRRVTAGIDRGRHDEHHLGPWRPS
jgi:hypothetical protein